MNIYNDYTTDEIMMDEPCFIDTIGSIYPVKVKDYNKFSKYIKYISLSKKHLGLGSDISLLEGLVLLSMVNESKPREESFGECIEELENLFSIIARDDVRFTNGDDLVFINEAKSFVIDKTNFNLFRQIVMKQNLIQEPKIYEDELQAKWMEKARIAKMKENPSIEIGEIMAIVSCGTGKNYREIKEQNILQLYADYFRLIQVSNYETCTLFRTVSDKVPNVNYIDGIIKDLYKDSDSDLTIDGNSLFSKL